jgi:hypothetical protein
MKKINTLELAFGRIEEVNTLEEAEAVSAQWIDDRKGYGKVSENWRCVISRSKGGYLVEEKREVKRLARTERLQVKLTPEVMANLKRVSGELGLPAGTLGAQIIGEYLKAEKRG